MSNTRALWLCALMFVVAFPLGFFVGRSNEEVVLSAATSIRENNTGYKFINPLLAVNRSDITVPSSQVFDLSKQVQKVIDDALRSGKVANASVYVINYGKAGGSFSIKKDDQYAPASLLKVVIMVALLKQAEKDPSILNNKLKYTPNVSNLDNYPFAAPSDLKIGFMYTVDDLLNRMIIDSDNGAKDLLLSIMTDEYLNKVYFNLGLQKPKVDSVYTTSVSDYSLFFRIMYNATYLSQQDSEKALSILSQATFKDGIVAGLPPDIVVAHKFGDYVNANVDTNQSIELHDCGIVYVPNGPYLLCVMTKGANRNNLTSLIQNISQITYGYLTQL